MKVKNIIKIILLLIFGLQFYLFKDIILEKSVLLNEGNNSLIRTIYNFELAISFLYPIFSYCFFTILFSISYLIITSNRNKNIGDIVFASMIPNSIFMLLNTYYALKLTPKDIDNINNLKSRGIIPFLNYDISSYISDLFFYLPGIFLFIYFCITKEQSLIKGFLISIFPMILIYLIYNII